MADTKDPTKTFVNSIWQNWCSLDASRRSEVASKLGAFGHVLSIAANVQQFASHMADAHKVPTSTPNEDSTPNSVDEDIIDVDFEEIS